MSAMSNIVEAAEDPFQVILEAHLPNILDQIQRTVEATSPKQSSLVSMCAYHMQTGGKRLRAILPLVVADALEHPPEQLIPFGAACEMLHNATLVHDDLQDGDQYRRGRATVWHHYGAPQAINLGDAMFYYAVLLAQELPFPAEVRERASRRLLLETLRVIDGQEQEFALKRNPHPSVEDYVRMVEGKTSGLFSLPIAGAAEICNAPQQMIATLERASCHLGVLFQVQDDVLDLYGDKGRDTRGSDIAEGKRSILVAHALETSNEQDRTWLTNILDQGRESTTVAQIEEVIAFFRRSGSLSFAIEVLHERRHNALAALREQNHRRLYTIVESLCERILQPIGAILQ